MPLAVVQSADSPQLESTAAMLRAAGYDTVKYCGSKLRDQLKAAGCDTVLAIETMERMGYDPVDPSITAATPEDMDRADLFAEIKVRNILPILKRWPRLEGRICYWRVNGSQPEVCPKGGDEINLPCPVVTACLWYGTDRYRGCGSNPLPPGQLGEENTYDTTTLEDHLRDARSVRRHDPSGACYVMWPPYPRMADYLSNARHLTQAKRFDPPYGLAHYMPSWGYGDVVGPVADLGVHLYGDRAPKGQVPHPIVARLAETALAFVHLKSVDCPGWALYEAMLSACPAVVGRMLNARMLAYELLEDGVTCLEFGTTALMEHGRGPVNPEACVADIRVALDRLRDPAVNRQVGDAGRARLLDLMWSAQKDADALSFREFCRRNFK